MPVHAVGANQPGLIRVLLLVALPATLALFASGKEARADTIRLRSGQVIVAEAVEVLDGRFRVRVEHEGTVSQVDLAFELFKPKTMLRVFDRYTDKMDPQRKLESAKLALRFGLPEEAKLRFRQAAQMDAGLEADSEAGLLEIGKQEATKALLDLETRLRKNKNPVAELAALEALLTGPHAGALSDIQRKRVRILIRLAKQVIAREEARKAKKDKKPAPAKKADDDDDQPDVGDPTTGRGRTYADERYRSRAPHRRSGPNVPGATRPPSGASGGSGGAGTPGGRSTPPARGSTPAGGSSGGRSAGGGSGGAAGGGSSGGSGGGVSPGGGSGGGIGR